MFSDIEAECQDDYMKIRIGFNGTFAGLVYSAGNYTFSTNLLFWDIFGYNNTVYNTSVID